MFGGEGTGSACSVSRFTPGTGDRLQHLDLQPRPSLQSAGSVTVTRGRRNPPAPPWVREHPLQRHPGGKEHPANCRRCLVFFHPGRSLAVPSLLLLSPLHLPARTHRAGERCQHSQTELPLACACLRAHAGARTSTRHPHACLGVTRSWAAPCQPRGVVSKLLSLQKLDPADCHSPPY